MVLDAILLNTQQYESCSGIEGYKSLVLFQQLPSLSRDTSPSSCSRLYTTTATIPPTTTSTTTSTTTTTTTRDNNTLLGHSIYFYNNYLF